MLGIFEEELLEPLARKMRFAAGINHIPKSTPLTIVDLGCGPKMRFFHQAEKSGVSIKKYVGIDPLIKKNEVGSLPPNAEIQIEKLDDSIPLKENQADVLVGFAFLEHIDHPGEILRDTLRVLKPGGKGIFTTPTPRAKKLLETMSYKLGIISRREIEEHKNYFTKETLLDLLKSSDKSFDIQHEYFEMGCNNLVVITKSAK